MIDKLFINDIKLSYNNLNTIKNNKTQYTKYEEPVNIEPINEEPVNIEPINEEPINEEPINEEPINEEPINEEPIKLYNNNIDNIALKNEQNDGGKTWGILIEHSSGEKNSVCFGGGRYVNQVIRAYGFSLFAEKFDLYMDYKGKDYIEKLGFKLYCGKNKYQNSEGLDDTNFFDHYNKHSINYNVHGGYHVYMQSNGITKLIYQKLTMNKNRKQIMHNNKYKYRYYNNNDCFLHIRLGDEAHFNAGFEYYNNIVKNLNYDTLYISSDSFDHEIVQKLAQCHNNVVFFNEDLPDIILFASTCKDVVLSYGSFSALIGYLSFCSIVHYKKPSEHTAWDWHAKNNMFKDKSSLISDWKEHD